MNFSFFKFWQSTFSKALVLIDIFKYLVLANMLSQSDINPFDSQEAKPYKSDPEIQAMTELREAYQNNDIDQFERILRSVD